MNSCSVELLADPSSATLLYKRMSTEYTPVAVNLSISP